jgi:hypothetical protein
MFSYATNSISELTRRATRAVAAAIDPVGKSISIVSSAHRHIHDGDAYSASYVVTTAATDAHRSGLLFKTPATGAKLHCVFGVAASAAATFSVCEAPTIAANVGTHTGAPVNRNREELDSSLVYNNATTPAVGQFTTLTEAQIAADGTWDPGTILRTAPVPAGDGPHAVGGSSRGTQEYVLDADTVYCLLITNVGANANTHYLFADWYENTDDESWG